MKKQRPEQDPQAKMLEEQNSQQSVFSLDAKAQRQLQEKQDIMKMVDDSSGSNFSISSNMSLGTVHISKGVYYVTMRSMAVIVLIITTAILGYLAYQMARDQEHHDFEAKVCLLTVLTVCLLG